MKFVICCLLVTVCALGEVSQAQETDLFEPLVGQYVDTLAPCAPNCYAVIDVNGREISTPTSGIKWDQLYALEEYKNRQVLIYYSKSRGVVVKHSATNKTFVMTGPFDEGFHPLDLFFEACSNSEGGGGGLKQSDCYAKANEAWLAEIHRTYSALGGHGNEKLFLMHSSWLKFSEAFEGWAVDNVSSRRGTKWIAQPERLKMVLLKQYLGTLQSSYSGY